MEKKRLVIGRRDFSFQDVIVTHTTFLEVNPDFTSKILGGNQLDGEEVCQNITAPQKTRKEIRDVLNDRLSHLNDLLNEMDQVRTEIAEIKEILKEADKLLEDYDFRRKFRR